MALQVLIAEHIHELFNLSLNLADLAAIAALCLSLQKLSNEEVNHEVLQQIVAVVDEAEQDLVLFLALHADAVQLDLLLALDLSALSHNNAELLDSVEYTNPARRESHGGQVDITEAVDVCVDLLRHLVKVIELNGGLIGQRKEHSRDNHVDQDW